jgi:hypothetical protein
MVPFASGNKGGCMSRARRLSVFPAMVRSDFATGIGLILSGSKAFTGLLSSHRYDGNFRMTTTRMSRRQQIARGTRLAAMVVGTALAMSPALVQAQ